MAGENKDQEKSKRIARPIMPARCVLAIAIIVLVAAYLFGIISGKIDKHQRLGSAEVGLTAVAVILVLLVLNPGLLNQLQSFKAMGIEVILGEVRDTQRRQEKEIKSIHTMISKGLSPLQLYHLLMLETRGGQGYKWDPGLKSDVRRLIDAKLVREKEPQLVDRIADFELRDLDRVLELTDDGKAYVSAIRGST